MPAQSAPHRLTQMLSTVAGVVGARWTALVVTVATIGFLVVGVVTGFDDWWHALIHSTAATVTLPMLFVLQHTTNRETRAILIKLDELVRATTDAEDGVMDLEDQEVTDQEALRDELHHGSSPVIPSES